MDTVCRSPSLKGSPVPEESDPCPICFVDFHGREVLPEVVKTQCGHSFDLHCVARSFVSQPLGSRRCGLCRQDPMPLVNEQTGKTYPDEFFPDQAFFHACARGNLESVRLRLAQGSNANAVTTTGCPALMLALKNCQFEVARLPGSCLRRGLTSMSRWLTARHS